ncbi:MAG TPA: flippase activity-associated protein Agl23, partial [Pyrinomonadaceae bacterium]|nr:flippase activity-associated protein Agl23 [Pyrinomonadaceae bacterium]
MSTISSKSHRNKQKQGKWDQPAFKPGDDRIAPIGELSNRTWYISAFTVLFVGAFLRLFKLTLVPLHHDEGVNGNFLVTLVREGKYFYDPQNYHGPTLYYFSAVIPWLVRFFGGKAAGDTYGLTTFNIRLVTVAFGVATIWLALTLRKRIGAIGALCAAGLIAISPGAIYLSRYFIHESLFVFFTLAIIVTSLKYYDTGRSMYLMLASIAAALMVATKETWIMNGPVLLIALISTAIYFRFRGGLDNGQASISESWRETIDRFGGLIPVLTAALTAFAVFIVVAVLFYSSFFTNYPKGVSDAFKTLNLWRQRTHEHEHPWWQYIYWLFWEEGVLMVLAAFGALFALWRADNRLALFLSLWSFGLLAAYSLVGYKTPWICLNF